MSTFLDYYNILNYPQKTYADQICLNDNTYNYAISARQDKPGLVICYTDITRFQNDKNELSLSNMLDAEMFRQDVTVVITDGMRVISTNCEQLENTLVQYYPIADVLVGGEQLTPDTLLQLKNDSGTWYGMFTQYRDYYLYAFFPSRVVYASRRGWMLLFTAIYLFCGMGYLIWRQYSKKRRLLRMEKEYHLVSAISSIYLSNLLIHPQDDTWEPVVQSERMKAITNGVLSAKAMLEKFNTECVAEAYREEFRAFTDLDTAQQRLEGKAFDGFTMENVEGKWYQLLLVPQRRFTHREKPSSLMLLFRDVSEQKERDMEYQENLRRAAEEATLANAAKTDFLRRMSHDIRTPINGIRGMVQIADRFPNDAKKQAECRAKIMRSSDFLLELVNDVLDMSKLESGEMQLEEVPFNLNELLHDVGTLLSTQAQARGITYTITMEASTNISVYSGDTDTITLTVKDANDKQLLAETEKTLRWEIAVDNNGVQQEVIECSKDDIKLNADGTFALPLTGFAAGEATVSITCTYPYGAATAAEPAKEVTATLYIGATTKPSDVLGLTNGSVYNQISLPHTPKKSTTSYTGTTVEYPENRPAMQGSALFLYATNEYTDLTGFTVDQIEITAGETTYTVGKDGITTDENHTYKVTVNDQWTAETNDTKFQYRAVKVESAAAGEITLKIVLKNGDVTYNLTTPYTIASNTYTVKFLDTKGNILLTKTVDYGKKPELTEEDKAKLKADAELGYTCTWALSEIYADTEIHPTLTPNTYTIQFDANGGLGTMPDESYAYDKIQTTDSLPPNKFTKGTSTFKGWAFDASSTTADYTDASLIGNIIDSMAKENKTELTLYAVWEDTAAGGETVEP